LRSFPGRFRLPDDGFIDWERLVRLIAATLCETPHRMDGRATP